MVFIISAASSSGSKGMSVMLPSTSNFQPQREQRSPFSSLMPKERSTPRCGHAASRMPRRPLVSRNPTMCSPSSRVRAGVPSGSASSRERKAGTQNLRNSSPMGLSGPISVTSLFSSGVSNGITSKNTKERARNGHITIPHPARHRFRAPCVPCNRQAGGGQSKGVTRAMAETTASLMPSRRLGSPRMNTLPPLQLCPEASCFRASALTSAGRRRRSTLRRGCKRPMRMLSSTLRPHSSRPRD